MIKKKYQKSRPLQPFFFFGVFIIGLYIVGIANILTGVTTMTGITGAVTAEEIFTSDLFAYYIKTYNEKAAGLPDIVFTFFGEEVINIYISDFNYYLFAILKDGELVELSAGQQESPTIEVETTYNTLVQLQNKEIELNDAIDDGLVTFSSDSFVKEAELAVVLYSIDIYNIFGKHNYY